MRTGCSLTVCRSLLPGGGGWDGVCSRGVSTPGGSAPGGWCLLLGGVSTPMGVCSQGGGVCSQGGVCSRVGGMSALGGVCSRGGACLLQGVSAQGVGAHVCSGGCLLPGGGVCSRGCLLWGGCLLQGVGVFTPRGQGLLLGVGVVSAPGGSVCSRGVSARWGCLLPGGCLLQGVSASGGVCSRGVCLLQGVSTPRGSVCSGGWHPSMHQGRHPLCEQNDKQVQKYYLGHNFIAAGKKNPSILKVHRVNAAPKSMQHPTGMNSCLQLQLKDNQKLATERPMNKQ